uniref:Drosophila melanogaster transposon HB2 n=1 Tax=Drosophila melanogaster TaxID=7227 RepID=V9H1G3_DROME|nr:unnamed protein product [Drosophila melanogaster]
MLILKLRNEGKTYRDI